MKGIFKDHVIGLFNDVPLLLYVVLLVLFCIICVATFASKGLKHGWKIVVGFLLSEYLILLYCSTVFFRPYNEVYGHDFKPFWSYMAMQKEGQEVLIAENIMNIVVFVPVGILLGCTFSRMKWWNVLLIGGSLSSSIELMQFVFKRGFTEFDDVMHNTLGCLIGYGFFSLMRMGYEKISKRRVAVL